MLLIASVAFAGTVWQETPTFKSSTRLVEIYATVFDHNSRAVDGLAKDQFEIRDDGVQQTIQVFETTDKSLSCALLLDTTGSMEAAMPSVRNAGRVFVEALRSGDSLGIFSFNDHVEELFEMSSDKSGARRALARLHAGGRTALFDAISHVALDMERHPGKKAIVVMTDGGDNASVLNRQSAANRARKVGIPIFAIAEGEALKDPVAANILHELAESTGGHFFKVGNPKDMATVFASIAADLANGYLLTFQPQPDEKIKDWHELQVLVKNTPKSVRVRARMGYSSN